MNIGADYQGGIDVDQANKLPLQPKTEESSSSLSVVSFKDINWEDNIVNIINISETVVRVESDRPMEPGFVWFNDRVRGHKGGILIWCQQFGERYRAVIRLVPLTREEERIVQERAVRSSGHRPRRSPEEIIATLTESMKRNSTSS